MQTYSDPKRAKFILVCNLHGVDTFPAIGNGLLATVTSDQSNTPVYDGRDNPQTKIRFWNAVLHRNFAVRYLCAS